MVSPECSKIHNNIDSDAVFYVSHLSDIRQQDLVQKIKNAKTTRNIGLKPVSLETKSGKLTRGLNLINMIMVRTGARSNIVQGWK